MKATFYSLFLLIQLIISPVLFSDSNSDFLKLFYNMSTPISKCNEEPRLREIYNFTKEKIESNAISIEFVNSLSQGDTIRFLISPKPRFQYSQEFLKNASNSFSLSYSQLIYQMQLAYFFLTNGDSASNMLSYSIIRTIVKTDCFYLMGFFINHAIVNDNSFKVTKYEQAIAKNIANNTFTSISMPLLNCNVDINNQLYTLLSKEITITYLDSYLQNVYKMYCEKELTEVLDKKIDKYLRYSKLMNILTYYNSSLEIINIFLNGKIDPSTIETSGLKSAQYIQACKVMSELNNDFISSTSMEIRSNWGLDF